MNQHDGARRGEVSAIRRPLPYSVHARLGGRCLNSPDVAIYVEALAERIVGDAPPACHSPSPFLLRNSGTAHPERGGEAGDGGAPDRQARCDRARSQVMAGVSFNRSRPPLHWFAQGSAVSKRAALARLEFTNGLLTLTEAGTKRRASLHLIEGDEALGLQNPGGIEVLRSSLTQFGDRLRSENHTLKRAL